MELNVCVCVCVCMLASLCKDDTTMQQETVEGCIKIKAKGLPTEGIGVDIGQELWGSLVTVDFFILCHLNQPIKN